MEKTVEMAGERLLSNAPMGEEERKLRTDLAACYRLAHRNGWDELIYNHISARVPGPEHHFLINPFGLAFDEVTASRIWSRSISKAALSVIRNIRSTLRVLPFTAPSTRPGRRWGASSISTPRRAWRYPCWKGDYCR